METPKMNIERIKDYLDQGKRFDGRKPEEFRDIEVGFDVSDKAEGSARVKLGKTEVIAGVKMSLGEPYPDSPNKGNFMVTAELTPLSSPRFETGPPRINAIELARVTDRALRESKLIEFEKLCIKEGEKVWTVFVDIYTINDDGNLMDAAELAAIIALKNARIPFYDEKEDKIDYDKESKTPLPLSKEIPISTTVHKIGEHFIVDPTREEEDASETRVTMGMSGENISSMQKGELEPLSSEEFEKILNIAEESSSKIFKKLEKYLK
jgi:exosome complex component RRP42